jgi:threonine/homoserine/homoserine lactone efflux protein
VSELAAFLAVAAVVIVTPGPDTALTVRNTVAGGRRTGVFTALGVAGGQLAWTLATSAGISALLLASEPAFAAMKLLGAAYLVVLGAQALRAAWRGGAPGGWPPGLSIRRRPASQVAPRLAPGTALFQGFASNLGNPKMAVFFTSLLPQFTQRGDAGFGALFLLGLSFCSLTLVWLTAYAIAVATAGDMFSRSGIRRGLEAMTGAVLIGLGVRLALARR